jgi:hypothetical protein
MKAMIEAVCMYLNDNKYLMVKDDVDSDVLKQGHELPLFQLADPHHRNIKIDCKILVVAKTDNDDQNTYLLCFSTCRSFLFFNQNKSYIPAVLIKS